MPHSFYFTKFHYNIPVIFSPKICHEFRVRFHPPPDPIPLTNLMPEPSQVQKRWLSSSILEFEWPALDLRISPTWRSGKIIHRLGICLDPFTHYGKFLVTLIQLGLMEWRIYLFNLRVEDPRNQKKNMVEPPPLSWIQWLIPWWNLQFSGKKKRGSCYIAPRPSYVSERGAIRHSLIIQL